eukprot:COSAG05_NODE_1224_length_5470_cov_4.161140_7_plen_205_part_00
MTTVGGRLLCEWVLGLVSPVQALLRALRKAASTPASDKTSAAALGAQAAKNSHTPAASRPGQRLAKSSSATPATSSAAQSFLPLGAATAAAPAVAAAVPQPFTSVQQPGQGLAMPQQLAATAQQLVSGAPTAPSGPMAALGLRITPESLIPGYDGSPAHFQRFRQMLWLLAGDALAWSRYANGEQPSRPANPAVVDLPGTVRGR